MSFYLYFILILSILVKKIVGSALIRWLENKFRFFPPKNLIHRYFLGPTQILIQNARGFINQLYIELGPKHKRWKWPQEPKIRSDAGTGVGPGGHCLPPSILGRSVNSIPMGDRFCPPFTTGTPQNVHLPASLIRDYGNTGFGVTIKLERFLSKNQHIQRKLLNFEKVSKIGHHLRK